VAGLGNVGYDDVPLGRATKGRDGISSESICSTGSSHDDGDANEEVGCQTSFAPFVGDEQWGGDVATSRSRHSIRNHSTFLQHPINSPIHSGSPFNNPKNPSTAAQ